jgi:hypothetical protein
LIQPEQTPTVGPVVAVDLTVAAAKAAQDLWPLAMLVSLCLTSPAKVYLFSKMDIPYMNVIAVVSWFTTPRKMKEVRTVAAVLAPVAKESMGILPAQPLVEKDKATPMFTLCHSHKDTLDF